MNSMQIVYHPLIIPSVVIPFTALLAALSAVATFIAGLFGLQLKAEGPKKLLEVLLKPKVLFVALVSNILIIGAIYGYKYIKNAPVFEWNVQRRHAKLVKPSSQVYVNSVGDPQYFEEKKAVNGNVELLWTKKLNSGSFRGATISGESIFLGLDDGTIQELDTNSGEVKRSFYIGTAVSANPIILDGFLYAGIGQHDTHHAPVYKFNLSTGEYLGNYQTKGHIEGKPVAAQVNGKTLIFIPSGADGVHAITPDLQQEWHVLDGHVDSSVQIANGFVFSGTGMEKEKKGTNKTFALGYDFSTGKQLWKRELPASSWMQSIAIKNKICFVFGEVYFASDIGGFACYEQKDGTPYIMFNNAAPIVSPPQYLSGDILTGDLHGKICRVSMENGLPKWCTETGKPSMSFANPIYDPQNGVIVYPSQKKGLFVINPHDGKIISNWTAEGSIAPWSSTYAPAAIAKDGSWIVADMKGVVRRFRWKKN